MSRVRAIGAGALSALLLAGVGVLPARSHPSDHVIANGGLPVSGGSYVLQGTLGQAVVGSSMGPGALLAHGFWAAGTAPVVAVGGGGGQPRLNVSLPHPNPSRGTVLFGMTLPQASRVRLRIYDVSGREVSAGTEQELAAGTHALEWRAGEGQSLSGVFFARLMVNGQVAGVRRIVILK